MPTRALILDHRGNPMRRAAPPVRARYDAAQTSGENRRHWAEADHLSARSANSTEVRQVLRDRARYEYANNGYAAGIVTTLANDLIGEGPRLQLLGGDPDENRLVEAEWCNWCDAVNLAEKLRTMRQARAVDGESFGAMDSNPRLPTLVKLDVLLYEAEQIHTPYTATLDPYAVDGIVFDRHRNPTEYHVLREHPGDDRRASFGAEFDRIPARYMIHWFKPRRPQEYRAVPELTPALPLFAQLRRYTLAVLAASETAADFAAIVYSELPPDTSDPNGSSGVTEFEPFDSFDIDKRLMTTLPAGWKMSQFKAEQPTTTHDAFTNKILNEIGRALNVPFHIAAGNSSSYNYASGRLDTQTYVRGLTVDQSQLGRVILDRLFAEWLAEAELTTDLPIRRPAGWAHRWLWPGMEHVDPVKEATAQDIQLKNYTTTFMDECYRDGVDPESRVRAIAESRELFIKYGLPDPYAPTPATPGPAQTPPDADPDAEDPADDGEDPDAQDPSYAARRRGQNGHAVPALVRRNGHV